MTAGVHIWTYVVSGCACVRVCACLTREERVRSYIEVKYGFAVMINV